MHHLFSKKIILYIVICIIPFLLSAQDHAKSYNYNSFKNKTHYFGLTIGYNSSGYKIEHSRRFIQNPDFRWNEGISNPGLTLSMITNFKLGQHFDFRILPSISLSYRTLAYQAINSNVEKRNALNLFLANCPYWSALQVPLIRINGSIFLVA